ncbi:TetR/AcrR family transcriptional regulator [Psychromarinibacter sp. C21-152]|uniref:TetR/AcrR family transcriptional regulator n=1 Tax=Psychromarinibacter sediminicola TaxID=3033385 RepID=A0AAE3TAW1_9RHOB|nr:TetR/AcrR family transcriptional regulator [Psychromarinibacter sediminicola]MDF0602005.1 TetR/AcrR family transcriptional regulator [Psychromarinibacter sediminicola]
MVRERALAEAMALLDEGPQALTLSAVARGIGLSTPALYTHFVNRDALLEEVRQTALDRMQTERQPPDAAVCPAEALHDEAHSFIAFARQNPALYRIVFAPSHPTADNGACLRDGALTPLTQAVDRAQAAGFAPGQDAEAVAALIWVTLHGAIMLALDGTLPGAEDARWDMAERSLSLLLSRLETPAAT